MEYVLIIKNLFIIYIKRLLKKGNWKFQSWQNIHHTVKMTTCENSFIFFGLHNTIERYGNIYVGKNAELILGNKNYFNQGLIMSCQSKVVVGNNCLFGPNVTVIDNNHKFYKNIGVSFELNKAPIEIGNNCWIGANVIILKGAKIGNNCVISANSVVTGIISDNSIFKQDRSTIIEKMR